MSPQQLCVCEKYFFNVSDVLHRLTQLHICSKILTHLKIGYFVVSYHFLRDSERKTPLESDRKVGKKRVFCGLALNWQSGRLLTARFQVRVLVEELFVLTSSKMRSNDYQSKTANGRNRENDLNPYT